MRKYTLIQKQAKAELCASSGCGHRKANLNALWNTPKMILSSQFEQRSTTDMAQLYGVSATAMRYQLMRYDLRRSLSDANRVRYRKSPVYLTAEQEQIVYGGLLGDACLYRQEKSTHFTLKIGFAQGQDQLDYLAYKRSVMGGSRISMRAEGTRWNGHYKPMYQFSYSNTQGLLPVEARVTVDGAKKVTSDWLSKLDWFGIAVWYMDDGTLMLRKGQPSSIRFYTNSFTWSEVDLLCDMLKSRGLSSLSVSRGNSVDEPVINAFKRKDLVQFIEQLKPYSVPCLSYKFQV